MSDYSTIAGFDRARGDALYARPLPNPLPANAVLVVGADWCSDTQRTMMNTGYATATPEGMPIFYFNDADAATHRTLAGIPGASILGRGFDAAEPPRGRDLRGYNYPTTLAIQNGRATAVVYNDIIPENGFAMAAMTANAQRIATEAAKPAGPAFELAKAEPLLNADLPAARTPDTVYAVVNRTCGHCQDLLARTGYSPTTEDGQAIVYVDLSRPEGQAFYRDHLTPVSGIPAVMRSNAQNALSTPLVNTQIDPVHFPSVAARATAPEQPAARDAAPPTRRPAAAPAAAPAEETPATPGFAFDQAQLLNIGIKISDAQKNGSTEAIRAIESFLYTGADANKADGKLSVDEATRALNLLQLRNTQPELLNQITSLGTTLGVEGLNVPTSSAPAATPAAATPEQSQQR